MTDQAGSPGKAPTTRGDGSISPGRIVVGAPVIDLTADRIACQCWDLPQHWADCPATKGNEMKAQCDHYTMRGLGHRGQIATRCTRPATMQDKRGVYCTQHGNRRYASPMVRTRMASCQCWDFPQHWPDCPSRQA